MPAASAPPVDERTGPPIPRRPAGGLTFKSPTAEEWLETDQETPATGEEWPTSLDDQLAGSPSDDESPDQLDHDDSDPTSSTASSGDRKVRALSRQAQEAAARQAVKIAGSMAHQYLARDRAAQAVGLYLVDDETAAQIGDPLARIAARHAPIDGAVANPDVADGIAAMLGVAKFVSVTIEKSSRAAAMRVNEAAVGPVDAA